MLKISMFKVIIFLVLLAQNPFIFAQSTPNLGTNMNKSEVEFWDRSISTDGKNLPQGSGDVMQGEQLYKQRCIACHGAQGIISAPNVSLAGGHGTLQTDKPVRTVGSYWPYATTLFDYIRRAMPYAAQKSLKDDEVYALTAYVLYINNIIEAGAIINNENLANVEMPNKNGFISQY